MFSPRAGGASHNIIANSVGTAALLSGDERGRDELERSLALATEAGLEDAVSRALTHLAWAAVRRRDYAVATGRLETALRQAGRRRGGAAARQAQPVVEAHGDPLHRQVFDPRGGQLNRQGQAVEPGADMHHRVGV